MANIMQMFRAKNKVTRDAYDLSKKLCFTAKAGELLPVYSRLIMPGDVFDITTKWKTRTAPVNKAAFTRFKEYYDWYFVPMNLLWDKYNTWMTNMTDNNQVATSIKGTTNLTDKHPYFTTYQIHQIVSAYAAYNDLNPNRKDGLNQFGFRRDKLMTKLLHYLGYGDFSNTDNNSHFLYNLELSPWRALAYQKIYQDWYRNSQWEASSPQTCNINYISGAEGDLQIPLGDYQIPEDTMFDLRYANWNKDLFMGVLPNSQYGDAASVFTDSMYNSNSGIDIPLRTSNTNTTGVTQAIQNSSGSVSVTTNDGRSVNAALTVSSLDSILPRFKSNFTILALRQAEALQKWKEITESNSKDFPSQIEAHYGVKPNNAYSNRSMRIGGIDGVIEIQDVDNTNITENSDGSFNGADIAGKGLALGSGSVKKFSSDVPGVLMCIYHVTPLLDYALANVSMDNMKTMFTDYAIPEFDKTGMTQVPLAAFTNDTMDIRDDNVSMDVTNALMGYAPNYIEYKTDIDEVKGAFYNGGLEQWVSPITNAYVRQWFGTFPDGTTTFDGIDWRFFKINPSVTNPIFAVADDSNVSTDKFRTNCYFDIKAVRPLDAQGLPY